jgi:hypothetical protein
VSYLLVGPSRSLGGSLAYSLQDDQGAKQSDISFQNTPAESYWLGMHVGRSRLAQARCLNAGDGIVQSAKLTGLRRRTDFNVNKQV